MSQWFKTGWVAWMTDYHLYHQATD